MTTRIILASASQRRSRILRRAGVAHKVVISDSVEIIDSKKGPEFSVLYNAAVKARKVAQNLEDGFVIGADTLVVLGKSMIGKPKSQREARSLMRRFSGRTILVYTGICVVDVKRNKLVKGVDISKIKVKKLSKAEQDRFVEISQPYDKAGGFSIEGPGMFIFDKIEGSFYNILGFSMVKLNELFKKLGVNLLEVC